MDTLEYNIHTDALTRPGALESHEASGRVFRAAFGRGRLELRSVADGILRVRFTPQARFAPRRSWAVTEPDDAFEAPDFAVSETAEGFRLALPFVTAHLARDGTLSFEKDGARFAEDAAPTGWAAASLDASTMRVREGDALPEGPASLELQLFKRLLPDESYYGFGQRTGMLERRGRLFTNWTFDPDWGHGRHQSNLYQAHPAFVAVRRGLAWGMFVNVTYYSQFDVGYTDWDTLRVTVHGGELDYYLFTGPTPAAVVEQLTRLTGRPLLPPLWALGYHQSRWGYKTEGEMRELVRAFRERDIPLDVLHFDIDYMRGYRDFTWDPERFPEPKKLLDDLKRQGVRAVTILDPGVKEDLGAGYAAADDGVAKDVFIKNPDGSRFTGYCWPDAALFPDFTREAVRRWWGDQLKESHVDTGVAGIWTDMNEPAIFDRPFSEGISQQAPMPLGNPQGEAGERTVHAEVHNLYGHLMSRATYEGLKRGRPDARPWVLTRSAFVGTQRYAASWMGDNSSWWEHLEMSVAQLASMSLLGVAWSGVDIGGFFENSNPELYARWIALGALYPFMRTHTCAGTRDQEPWSFGPEVEAVARDAIRLRYRLLPYLYTLAFEAFERGAPLFRPLVYDFPDDETARHIGDQAMVGPQLLVAPVTRPGVRQRALYLPEGAWYDFWTGARVRAGHSVVEAPLERLPVFVRGGSVLPLGNVRASTSAPLTELTLRVYGAEGGFTLVEDAGDGFGFERGEVARTPVRVSPRGDTSGGVRVTLGAREGGFTPHPRTVVLERLAPDAPERVTLDGREVAAEVRGGAVRVRFEDDGKEHVLEF
ncbi:glycoside hydrolase family 31 protein [Truepera radiovictrix]|uniref:Alpha-glucosidase n=1 Tax=Truepera radiovictrix (strain DSM 17093 / CIP 108686 / LMG 22925 / RQ-24) TaxID=649638 RepID=D7CQ73_TRURR|nr:glycoside hydrolase family 31 protein [Truepera radiovictrix]ADI14857.1 Alpha-glucosidase [Truepera radiovictrix DSM 17093]WMT56592.1 glycoside hydrolase family 31 protein [Truepera radiovictrix]